jgi:hypothetical protein
VGNLSSLGIDAELDMFAERVVKGAQYPGEFLGWKRDGQRVQDLVTELWPTAPAQLPNVSEDDSLTILITAPEATEEQRRIIGEGGVGGWLPQKLSKRERAALAEDGPPAFMVMRFANVIPSSTLAKLLVLWDTLSKLDVKYPAADPRRSGNPALHLGVWELYMSKPKVTTDARQTRQGKPYVRQEVVEAIDALCGLIRAAVVPRLERLMDEYAPGQRRVQERYAATPVSSFRSHCVPQDPCAGEIPPRGGVPGTAEP